MEGHSFHTRKLGKIGFLQCDTLLNGEEGIDESLRNLLVIINGLKNYGECEQQNWYNLGIFYITLFADYATSLEINILTCA